MASNAPASGKSCIVCLSSNDLRSVGRCQHGACVECLTKCVERSKNEDNVFSCPICLSPCLIPIGGIHDLPKFVQEPSNGERKIIFTPTTEKAGCQMKTRKSARGGKHISTTSLEKAERPMVRFQRDFQAKCTVCRLNGEDVQAVAMCLVCDDLCLCKNCSGVHGRNKATRNHAVKELLIQQQTDDLCQKHGRPSKMFCLTCNKAVCSICLLVTHGDHAVESLIDLITSKKVELKELLTQEQKTLSEVEQRREQLLALNDSANLVDNCEELFTAFEQQGDKIIDSVAAWKAEKKEDARIKYEVIPRIANSLKDCALTADEMKSTILKASEELAASGEKECDYHKLITLITDIRKNQQTQLLTIPQQCEMSEQLEKLRLANYTFLPEDITNFGNIVSNRLPEEFRLEEVSVHTLQAAECPRDRFIFHMCIVGNERYAVHLYDRTNSNSTIFLNEMPSHTLKHKIALGCLCRGLSTTPEGYLASIVTAKNGNPCNHHTINIYDTETGEVNSTFSLSLGENTIACDMAVTPEYTFVILCHNAGGKEHILVTDKGGVKQSEHRIDGEYDVPPKLYAVSHRISSGGKFIFVRGRYNVCIFQMARDGLRAIKSLKVQGDIRGNTSTASGDFFVIKRDKDQWYMVRFQKRAEEWTPESVGIQGDDFCKYCPLATKDGRSILTAFDKTIRLYTG